MKLQNKYYILRHGEAVSNVREVCSSWPERFKNPLTRHGKEMILVSAEMLKDLPPARAGGAQAGNHAKHGKSINMIFASPLLRTKQTSQIVARVLNSELEFDKSSTIFNGVKVVLDKRLREVGFGILNSKPINQLNAYFKNEKERVKKKMARGESYQDVLKRVYGFLRDTDKKYRGKSILIVSHECPLWILESKFKGIGLAKALDEMPREGERIHWGEIRVLN